MRASDYLHDPAAGLPFAVELGPGPGHALAHAAAWLDVQLDGRVHLGERVQIAGDAQLQGPVWVGNDVQIGAGALIRPYSVLGDGCVVGHGAELKSCLCLAGAKIQSGAFAGDSILGQGARLASGVILANRRFDQGAIWTGDPERQDSGRAFLGAVVGDWARLGANAVCAPGTLIGRHTWIGGLVHAHGVLPPGKLVLLRQEWEIRDKPDQQLD